MSLLRKQIRAKIVETLKGNTDADQRVYPNRVLPVFLNELPAIIVNTESEQVEVFAEASPREYERTLTVKIEIMCEESSALDDELDIIGAQVEAALFEETDHTLGELCHDVNLVGCEMAFNKEGEKSIGSLILTYEVVYHSVPARDAENLEWLETVVTRYNLVNGTSATQDASDIVDVGE